MHDIPRLTLEEKCEKGSLVSVIRRVAIDFRVWVLGLLTVGF